MSPIDDSLQHILERIDTACQRYGRNDQVGLMLAVKAQTPQTIVQATNALAALRPGPVALGHNRVQEMVASGPALAEEAVAAHQMRLIGPLQHNKINHMLRWADGIETVASLELAKRLEAACQRQERQLDVMVQVNVSGEQTKSGISPDVAVDLACQVGELKQLNLIGLMTIGLNSSQEGPVRAGYANLRELAEKIAASGAPGTAGCTQLSMGMTNDIEWAIAEGSTQVRVGRAVFGERN